MTNKPFKLIRIDIRRRHFNRRRQIQNNLIVDSRLPYIHDGSTNLNSKIHLCRRVAFGRILQCDSSTLGNQLIRVLLNNHCRISGKLNNLFSIHFEDNFTLQGRSRIIKVEDHVLGTDDRFTGTGNQIFSSLTKNLNGHIIRD